MSHAPETPPSSVPPGRGGSRRAGTIASRPSCCPSKSVSKPLNGCSPRRPRERQRGAHGEMMSQAKSPGSAAAWKAGAHAKPPRRKGAALGGRAVSGDAARITCGPEGKARAEALRRREMTPKSVTAPVDLSPLDAPIGIGIGIGIEPDSSIRCSRPAPSARFDGSPSPLVRDCRTVERRRRRPPLHGEFLQGQMGSPVAACAAGGSEPDLCVSRPSAALR